MASRSLQNESGIVGVVVSAQDQAGNPVQVIVKGVPLIGASGNAAQINSNGQLVTVLPDVLITGGGIGGIAPRLRVDPGSTGFFAKREVTTFREFSQALGTHIPNGQRVLVRFISPVNFILRDILLVGDNGQIRVPLFAGGTPTGTFSTTWPVIPTNSMTEGPSAYTPQIGVTMAGPGAIGAVDITGGVAFRPIRLKIENATGAATTGSGAIGSEFGLPAATYYALVENIGAGVFEGVMSAIWEERP